ncbi:MAG: hypothetical protein M1130_13460 [Actinobacteria bacterium]|nr:hypothetical protein [Actinomycetota bacterium]
MLKRIIGEIEDGCEAVVLKTSRYFEPLFSVYSRKFARKAETCLKEGIYKLTAPLSLVSWKAVEVDPSEFPDLKKWLMNVITRRITKRPIDSINGYTDGMGDIMGGFGKKLCLR